MSAMPHHPVHLNTKRLDEEVTPNMPPFRPTEITIIGWRSIGAHTVVIRQQYDTYGYRLRVADKRGRYTRTLDSYLIYEDEAAAMYAARQHLQELNALEPDA